MNIIELIDSLWEKSSHGTDRETVVMIFNAALEEAAKVCENMQQGWESDDQLKCAAAIRTLKGVKK